MQMDMQNAYLTYEGEIGVRVSFLINEIKSPVEVNARSLRLCTYEALKKRASRTPALKLREGKGMGNEALYSFKNLPYDWQIMCREKFGDPEKVLSETAILERVYQRDWRASEFYNQYRKPNGEALTKELIETYTANASTLNAIIAGLSMRRSYRKALGGSVSSLMDSIKSDVEIMREKNGHTLKLPSLQRTLTKYKKEGYAALISGKVGNTSAAKVVDANQLSVLQELLKKHNKYDNVQIATVYNEVAKTLGWKSISDSTVANYRKEFDLYIYAGNSGVTNLRNNRSMQHKRRAPNVPMVYWTIDGWDVELFYQKTTKDKEGKNVTTYHHRPTVVVVLDPCLKYPVGYAIGTHETPELIKQALRNAANHTRDLFGKRYKSLQIQTDHYGKGTLVPIYEAMTSHYTPARVKNAKAKVVEPYFKELNKDLQLISPNWSGFGITSRKENQPNADYLNKIRHSFPDFNGVCRQIEQLIAVKRMAIVEEYVKRWHMMADADHVELTDEEYLYLFGETTGYTNRLEASGVNATILGQKYSFDTFDLSFRENKFVDWCVKFDPEDLSKVLVVNAKSRDGRLEEEIGTVRFMLEQKYVQPMALYDRTDGDAAAKAKVDQFNKMLEEKIIERNAETYRNVEQLFNETKELDNTLSKIVLVDSRGQHKDQRNTERQKQIQQGVDKIAIKEQKRQERIGEERTIADRKAFLESKSNLDEVWNNI
ncbi:hypothetical protein [Sphingobacterium thalpophilum]|uniref:hypothetical protein n=1 Tax=Sphingobacterium thalpophilum TaxID=259 RepID=UPI0024A781DD|nr:hypothetical protein [Sphingobacterium thalpophilum]